MATVPCKYCGTQTAMLGTKLCDPCWETARAVERNPALARRVLAELGEDRLEAVERAARLLIQEGLRTTPNGLIVRENKDRSDPHHKLCEALEAIAPLNT